MTIDVRQACHPEAVRRFDTEELRRHFLVERSCSRRARSRSPTATSTGSCRRRHAGTASCRSPTPKAIGSTNFLERRELGIVNVGGPGRVMVDDATHELSAAAMRSMSAWARGEVALRQSPMPANPAKFYLVSTPAHAAHPRRCASRSPRPQAWSSASRRQSNKRTIYQMHPPRRLPVLPARHGLDAARSPATCGTPCRATSTTGAPRSISISTSMPTARVFHLMGEPARDAPSRRRQRAGDHLAAAGRSIPASAPATTAFIWAMGGDNQDYHRHGHGRHGDLR